MLVEVKMRMEMDQENRIETFEEIMMADPIDSKKSLNETINTIRTYDFYSEVYPSTIMQPIIDDFENRGSINPPKTVFLPSRSLWRKMIRALVKFGPQDQTNPSKFLLRFALVENPVTFLEKKI